MGVPAMLLRRMYVVSSLRNTADGFQFSLKNRLAPATIVGIGTLETGQHIFPPHMMTVEIDKTSRPATAVDGQRPLTFDINDVMVVHVAGNSLPPGHQALTFHICVREVGWLHVPVADEVTRHVFERAPQPFDTAPVPLHS